jgi:LL-diaminopimelate aminotransferase
MEPSAALENEYEYEIEQEWCRMEPHAGFTSRACAAAAVWLPFDEFVAREFFYTQSMAQLNDHYLKLKAGYLFPEIARRVKTFCDANPEAAKRLIRCGIGDVTEPLPPAAIAALHRAVDEMGARETFKGYGPEQGYEWLRAAIAKNDFRDRGSEVADDEIFVSDGTKCDTGNILDILGAKNKIAISDPVYPVYVDTNVMAGHTGEASESGAYAKLVYLPCRPANGFVPAPPRRHVDVIYLCSPNNPTGAVATRPQLEAWVKYALEHKAVILFDAAYEAYIGDPELPHSIYEIAGARECAIEFRSFSKNGGFTGVRCAYTVVPKSLNAQTKSGEFKPLHPLWSRRMTTKFNGVSYIVQRAAEALYSTEGKLQVRALIEHYLGNARVLRKGAKQAGLKVFGGVNAPYLWVRTPKGVTSWQAFDKILSDANVVITPGSGFGSKGEGFFRISAFNSRANAEEVARRLPELKW